MKNNFRHCVMSLAHRISSLAQMNWSIVLKKTCLILKLVAKICKDVVSFQYQKIDGYIGTSQGDL